MIDIFKKTRAETQLVKYVQPLVQSFRDSDYAQAVCKDINDLVVEYLQKETLPDPEDFNPDRPEVCLAMLTEWPLLLEKISNQTEEMCYIAVKKFIEDFDANIPAPPPHFFRGPFQQKLWQFVKVQSERICLLAVQRDPYIFPTCRFQTEAVYSALLEKDRDLFFMLTSRRFF